MTTTDTANAYDPNDGIDLSIGIGSAVILSAVAYCAWLGSPGKIGRTRLDAVTRLNAVMRRGLAPDWANEDPPANDETLRQHLMQGLQLVGNRRGHMSFAVALRALSPVEQSRKLHVFVYPKLQTAADRAWWARYPDVAQDPDYADLVNSANFCWPDPNETRRSRARQVVDAYWPDFTASVRALLEL